MFITLPGIGGSDREHWQSAWEATEPAFCRFQPKSWDQPDLNDWSDALERAVLASKQRPVLVAHSLACLLVAHWAVRSKQRIAGAFLVSVPDPGGPAFPSEAASFRDAPESPFPFPALIIASANDPYGSLDHARMRASQWDAPLVVAGELGHINSSSRLGSWATGRALLEAFTAGLKFRARQDAKTPKRQKV